MYAWKEGSRTCQYDNLRDVLRFLTVEEALVCFEWPRSEVLPWFCSRGGKCHNIYFEERTGWRKTFYCLYSCIVYLFSDSAQNLLSRQPTILPSGLVKKWSQSLLGLTYGHPVHMNVGTVVSCGAAGVVSRVVTAQMVVSSRFTRSLKLKIWVVTLSPSSPIPFLPDRLGLWAVFRKETLSQLEVCLCWKY